MSRDDHKDLEEKLSELSKWQMEQQKKLKAFQEAQRKLLDSEHKNILNSLRTLNFDHRNKKVNERLSNSPPDNGFDLQNFRNSDGIFKLKSQPIQLDEPKTSLFNLRSSTGKNNDEFLNEDDTGENFEERESIQPRKFLKRGEGLARFRMSLEDFKGPPKIYKEKRFKTYLNSKPESALKNIKGKTVKSSKQCNKQNAKSQMKSQNKSVAVPVKIYMPETKPKKIVSKNVEVTQNKTCTKNGEINLPKRPIEELALKPCAVATEWYNAMKEKEKIDVETSVSKEPETPDSQNKKDEKELKIFEILEKKVDDSSFCSTSSFVNKFMEQSLSSTPSKSSKSDIFKKSYSQGLKSLRSQFLNEDQIKRFEEMEDLGLEIIPDDPKSEDEDEVDVGINLERIDEQAAIVEEVHQEKEEEEDLVEVEDFPKITVEPVQVEKKSPEPHKVNKTLLHEYIKDFQKFKYIFEENEHRIQEPEEQQPVEDLLPVRKEPQINQHEIALKLQRKGLQDNVKQLLNWECPPRKRQPKRVLRKAKPKPTKSKPVDKEQGEKIIFSSGLIKARLDELEKEIDIFRKENKNLEKLQRECQEEKTKLAKEKKEFEKHMLEEREKFEAKIAEEHKKLQRDKMVFEKYCKQVKSQPSRQEREEIASLKKELEKVTETLTTKESRWGASQARLRNQIKALEKENNQLKAEVEKYKKQAMKKVSFENERTLNTKIINAINSELGRLKPTVTKNSGKNHSSSARMDRNLEQKPIRRIKSVPNMKKPPEMDVGEGLNECEDKGLGSVSTDSGIETNGRYAGLSRSTVRECSQQESSRSPVHEETSKRRSSGDSVNDRIESAVCEALFGGSQSERINPKISEIKNRIKRLNLMNRTEEKSENLQRRTPWTSKDFSSSCEEITGSSDAEEEEEEEEDEKEDKENDFLLYSEKQRTHTKIDTNFMYSKNSLIDNKIDESGVWEKVFEDGSKEISYPNGNVKKIFPGNRIVKTVYYNGDIKETNVVEGSEKYYYAETKTWHTTYKDGLEVLEFPNGQTERRHADGSIEISFPNGCIRYCDPSGKDEWRFLDGTVIKTNESGHKILLLPNGQKEIHTKEFKRREYPDGTVKILHADGTQETRYANGRVRLKDKEGNLLMDSGGIR